MSEVSNATTDVQLLRAILGMAGGEGGDAGSEAALPALLARLLDCQIVLTLADETVLMLPHTPTAWGPPTELVVDATAGGVVRGHVRLRRAPDRPFGERELILCDALRPHVSAWILHLDESGQSGCAVLTERQVEILGLVRCGLSNKEVARALGVTRATVRKHLENAFLRLEVASRTAAVAVAFGQAADREGDRV